MGKELLKELTKRQLLIIKDNNVDEIELSYILQVIRVIQSNDHIFTLLKDIYELDKFKCQTYFNKMFAELCKIKDKSSLYVVDDNMISYIYKNHRSQLINPSIFVNSIAEMIDETIANNCPSFQIAKYLTFTYMFSSTSRPDNVNQLLKEFEFATYTPLSDVSRSSYMRLLDYLMGYIYLKQEQVGYYDGFYEDVLNTINQDRFHERMVLNGAFNTDADNELIIHFIKQAIDITARRQDKMKK